MTRKRTYSTEALAKARSQRRGSYRNNPDLRRLANRYVSRGFDPVDAVRRAIEDLFPTKPGDKLEYPGVGAWKMGEERLSHRISDNLRSLRAEPGVWAGDGTAAEKEGGCGELLGAEPPGPVRRELTEEEERAYEELAEALDNDTDWEEFWREAGAALGAAGYRMDEEGRIVPPDSPLSANQRPPPAPLLPP